MELNTMRPDNSEIPVATLLRFTSLFNLPAFGLDTVLVSILLES